MVRRSITIPTDLTIEIRAVQAKILVEDQQDISFNGVLKKLVREAIDSRKTQETLSLPYPP